MTDLDPWGMAQQEFRSAREALVVLDQAVPAFRTLVHAFREPMRQFMILDAASSAGRLSGLAQTLSLQATHLSEARQIISSNVSIAKHAIERYRTHLHAIGGGHTAYGELQRLADRMMQGVADIERMIAEAERLMAGEVQRILELALRFDLPAGVSQLAQRLIDRARG